MSDIPIKSTIKLDHCWICGSIEGLHEHHVVPQSCGGEHGPTVTICAAHHTVIHTEAYQQPANRRFRGRPLEISRLAYLTDVIYISFNAVRGVAKPVLKTFKFSIELQRKWNAFRSTHPSLTNDQLAMERAIELLYQQNVAPIGDHSAKEGRRRRSRTDNQN